MSIYLCSLKCSKAVFPGGCDGFIVMLSLLSSYIGNSHVILLKCLEIVLFPFVKTVILSLMGILPRTPNHLSKVES